MSKTIPTKAIGPPGRPLLPPEAEVEIMEKLFANMKISSGEIAAILARHGVSGNSETLQETDICPEAAGPAAYGQHPGRER